MPGKIVYLTLAVLFATALLAVPPSVAETLYGADGAQGHSSNLYILDPSTGAVSSTVGAIGFAVTGMAQHPMTGVLYGSTSNNAPVAPGSLITIDKTTGAGTLIGSFGFKPGQGTLADITFTSDGTLYGWGSINANGDLWTVDLATGAATRVGDSGLGGNNGGALAADASDTLYLCIIEDDDFLRTVDRTTGLVTKGPKLDGTTDDAFSAMKFNSAGQLYASRLHTSTTPATATLVTIDKATGHITAIGPTVNRLDAIVFACSAPVFGVPMVAAIAPSSRSVQVGTTATAYVSIINAGTAEAVEVGISPKTPIAANFAYQSTVCATNALIPGTVNEPVDIPPGGRACFAIFLTPTAPFDPVEVTFSFAGCNTTPVTDIPDVNTFLFSGSATPVPDIVAQAATLSGDGIVNVAGADGTGVFAVAVSDVGSSSNITASVDFGGAVISAIVTICQTDPLTGACLSPPVSSSVPFFITGPGPPPGTATFGIFVQGTGFIPFDPAKIRIFVRFRDAGGVIRGATSVAVRTQ